MGDDLLFRCATTAGELHFRRSPHMGAAGNGVLLVAHYQNLMTLEGASLSEAVRRGSRERLAPVLMTALTAGLALIPLVLGGGKPGN